MKALALALLLSAGCGPRPVHIGKPVVANTPGAPRYSYVKVGEDYELLAPDQAGLKAGMERICGPNICDLQRVGELYVIRVTERP